MAGGWHNLVGNGGVNTLNHTNSGDAAEFYRVIAHEQRAIRKQHAAGPAQKPALPLNHLIRREDNHNE